MMIECQHHDKHDPRDNEKEQRAVDAYRKIHECYLAFLRQKAKIAWIQQGDENSGLFHRAIRKRRVQNSVYGIQDMNGCWVEGEKVEDAFITYYQELLSIDKCRNQKVCGEIMKNGPVLNSNHQERLLRTVTDEEIHNAMFSIPGDKSPGPDGFGTHFFKDTWSTVGTEISAAIKDFFTSGKLLKEVNTTILTLIPKVKCPSSVSEFRPIACCNTIYKCITKVMCARLKSILPAIVSENQGAFIQGRFIGHNIMICQDLVRNFGRKNSSPGCIIKMDMKKAYDSISWQFVEEVLVGLNFRHFIDLIIECVCSPRFTLMINAKCYGFFEGKRGLRQGDPISPLLFVLCMEYLSRTLKVVGGKTQFKFHPRCKGVKLNHLCFADDVILCCRGDFVSVYSMFQGFKHFSEVSALEVNEN